jgi:hypothetical protein
MIQSFGLVVSEEKIFNISANQEHELSMKATCIEGSIQNGESL